MATEKDFKVKNGLQVGNGLVNATTGDVSLRRGMSSTNRIRITSGNIINDTNVIISGNLEVDYIFLDKKESLDMVQNEINGYITNDISSESLKETLLNFLNNDVTFSATEIRTKAIEKYDLLIQANQYINLYKKSHFQKVAFKYLFK